MPSTDIKPPGPGETVIRRTTTSYSKKVPWLPLIAAALLIPLLLTVLATCTGLGERDPIETDLTSRSQQALEAAGISGAAVSFEGRDATISGVPAGQEDAAKAAVDGVDGVRVAEIAGAGGAGSDGALTVDATADKITLSGEVPDEATKAGLVKAAEEKAGDREVVDELTVAEGAKPGLNAAGVGATGGAEVNVKADGDTVTLSGKVPSEEAKAAAEAEAKKAAPEATVDNQLEVDTSKADLQKQIDALIKEGGIGFDSGKATLTDAGDATVQKIAEVLKSAPEAQIRVDGHVAARKGKGNQELQQTFSEQRAEAVKARLVELGISDAQISTKGFGATKPIADRSTPEGQAANRRVEINVL